MLPAFPKGQAGGTKALGQLKKANGLSCKKIYAANGDDRLEKSDCKGEGQWRRSSFQAKHDAALKDNPHG
jgi:hypothetical protein